MSRMNVFTTATLCLILGVNPGSAQGLYLSANAGYALGAGTQEFGSNTTYTGATVSYEGVYGSLGEGFKFGVSGGYVFSENLGAELGLSYWLGKTIQYTEKSTGYTATSKMSGSGIVAVPSIVVSANIRPVNPYARVGLVFGILRVAEESSLQQPVLPSEAAQEESGNLAFGFAGALGVIVATGGAVDLFAEMALHAVTYSPGQSEVTRFTVGGVDRLSSVPQKVVEYKESFTSGGSSTALAVRRPFSSVGLQVGVRMKL